MSCPAATAATATLTSLSGSQPMRARFLGTDPDSQEGQSPTLFATDRIDRSTFIAQGWTDDDIRGWTRITGSETEAEALLASLHTLEVQHAEWQRQITTGLRPHQREIAELDAKTRFFRAFEATFIPGLLQTAGYARHRFAQSITVFKVKNDIDEAVRARVRRQEILYRPDKRFHFVLTEAALRYRLCPPGVMLGQLDRQVSSPRSRTCGWASSRSRRRMSWPRRMVSHVTLHHLASGDGQR